MPTPRSIQRTYLLLMLGNTLAASLIWGINTIFLLDAGLSNPRPSRTPRSPRNGHLRGPDRDRRRHDRPPHLVPAGHDLTISTSSTSCSGRSGRCSGSGPSCRCSSASASRSSPAPSKRGSSMPSRRPASPAGWRRSSGGRWSLGSGCSRAPWREGSSPSRRVRVPFVIRGSDPGRDVRRRLSDDA